MSLLDDLWFGGLMLLAGGWCGYLIGTLLTRKRLYALVDAALSGAGDETEGTDVHD